jgi:hypothetical protein
MTVMIGCAVGKTAMMVKFARGLRHRAHQHRSRLQAALMKGMRVVALDLMTAGHRLYHQGGLIMCRLICVHNRLVMGAQPVRRMSGVDIASIAGGSESMIVIGSDAEVIGELATGSPIEFYIEIMPTVGGAVMGIPMRL